MRVTFNRDTSGVNLRTQLGPLDPVVKGRTLFLINGKRVDSNTAALQPEDIATVEIIDSTSAARILRAPDNAAASAVSRAFLGWRFVPAMIRGCWVEQLVQTAVAR